MSLSLASSLKRSVDATLTSSPSALFSTTTSSSMLSILNLNVVFVVDNCKPVDLAPPLGLGQELHSHLISVDGSVAKQSSRDQDVLVVAVFESGFCAAINKSSEQQVF